MVRFIYSANGMAVAGRFSRPLDTVLQPQAACVLPSMGGRVVSQAPAFRLTAPGSGELMLAFDSAQTTIEGGEDTPGVHVTVVRTLVRGLNVGNVLKADEVTAVLTLSYRQGQRKVAVDTAGTGFTGLTLAGQPLAISLDHDLSRAASDYNEFRRRHPHLLESHGATRYSLARHPSLKFASLEYGYLDQAGFGRVYFCEWSASHFRQSITMLRLRLGSPQQGELEVGGVEGNGQEYP